MGYVAIKGGGRAIAGTKDVFDFLRSRQPDAGTPLATDTIEQQLRLLHGRVLSEGGVYAPQLASLALKQAQGDTLEAAFILRAYRSTQPRLAETPLLDTTKMRLTRRISAAFKDIPGGQMLGATTDYHLRMLRMELLNESPEQFRRISQDWFSSAAESELPDSFPKVLDGLRQQGLLPQPDAAAAEREPFDITREPLIFPVPRSAALATMARAEQGSLLAIAYSNMRGYGDVHPTVAELRVGYLPVLLPHPITGELTEVGEVEMTECEVIAMYEDDTEQNKAVFTLGYGACYGHNEVKAISMAILDRALQAGMQHGPRNPSEDPEFVLLHVDGIDSMGFCTHYKMPHYVTFQSDMDRLRTTQKKQAEKEQNG
jgi:alpha-D-ribose 1-methylphosphonate 5-triphosphate synthase subunit PhnI